MVSSKPNNIFTISSPKTLNLDIKQLSKPQIEEKLIRDLKPILKVARIFGIAPYSMNHKNLNVSKNALIYSTIFFTFFTFLFIDRLYIYIKRDWPPKLQTLYLVIAIGTEITLCSEFITCTMATKKLQSYLNFIRCYDMSTKYEDQTKKTFVNGSWMVLMGSFLFYLPIIGLTYELDVKPILGAIGAFTYLALLTLGILKFLAFTMIIFMRFRSLNQKLTEDLSSIVEMDYNNRSFNCQEAWQRHEYLIAAAKKLNSIYSTQFLVWFSSLSLNSLLHIHEFLAGNHKSNDAIRGIFLTLLSALLLTALAAVCHLTTVEANKMREILSSPKFLRRCNSNEKQDIFLIGQYFQFNSFQFSASGFFNINLSVLMTVASAMTTYLVILIPVTH